MVTSWGLDAALVVVLQNLIAVRTFLHPQHVFSQCVAVILACTLFSCTHEDFFTYEPPPSPEQDNRIEFELTQQWEGGESQSSDTSLDPIRRAKVQVEIPASCPGGEKAVTFEKTTYSGRRLGVVLFTAKGFPLGFYQERNEADPCDEVGPFYEIYYTRSYSDSEFPFISKGQAGNIEVVHTFFSVPAISFSTDLFRMEEVGGEMDTLKINVHGRVYTRTIELE